MKCDEQAVKQTDVHKRITLFRGRSNRPHFGSCDPIRSSVCPFVPYTDF